VVEPSNAYPDKQYTNRIHPARSSGNIHVDLAGVMCCQLEDGLRAEPEDSDYSSLGGHFWQGQRSQPAVSVRERSEALVRSFG
jgi:hypothetical protein